MQLNTIMWCQWYMHQVLRLALNYSTVCETLTVCFMIINVHEKYLLWIHVHVTVLSPRCLKLRLGSEVGCVRLTQWCRDRSIMHMAIHITGQGHSLSLLLGRSPTFLLCQIVASSSASAGTVILPHYTRSVRLTPINAHRIIKRSYSKLSLWRHSYKVADVVTVYLLSTLAAAQSTRVG